jgi:CPA2 family monovalent cation:H+ antiporter-2
MAVVTLLGHWIAASWGWTPGASWLFGVGLSVASTVVILRNLMDAGLLDSPAGRASVGWLVVEDLATVLILVLLPAVVAAYGNVHASAAEHGFAGPWTPVVIGLAKAIAFLFVMLVVGARVMPAVLNMVASTRSRELFVLVALTAAVGTALAAAELFGVSLALGAFIAGLVVSESPFSHQVSADLLPFREAFAVVFFVSVGMLVDPTYLVAHWKEVVIVSLLVVVGKGLLSTLIVSCLPYPARTALVLGAGTSQIGEFSFIIGQAGISLGLLSTAQYSLLLAGAIVSITINPLMFRLIDPTERLFRRVPPVWRFMDRHGAIEPPKPAEMSDHVVIVGSGRVGRHIAEMLGRQQVPRLVVESNPFVLAKLQQMKVPTLFGDAANSEILGHARLDAARLLVITVPDDVSAMMMVEAARRIAPNLRILARASSWDGGRRLLAHGASQIVRPELEGGVELLRQTLKDLSYPDERAQELVDLAREEAMADRR